MNLKEMMESSSEIFIRQIKEWGEILLGFETVNKFEVLNSHGQKIGFLAEEGGGIIRLILRQILRSHRPLNISLFSLNQEVVLKVVRPFYFFFSVMEVFDGQGDCIGRVERRFGVLYKKYDLRDKNNNVFSHIKAPIWSLWRFPIYNLIGERTGIISKKWGGILKEVFTDADQFGVQMPDVSWEKKSIIFACAISIDLDFFEENQKR
ncbi:phospholipid scramblase-related protein [Bacteriovoracaceae bacterium]|nr:phospholipid scramblase-related protein [Bacteriovoracaceae bacterium]